LKESQFNSTHTVNLSDRYLESIKAETQIAYIVFHHQVQKKSFVAKQFQRRFEIDTLFTYFGAPSNDTSCLKGGLFNYFGQINLLKDSSISTPFAELHFVIEGNCEGFYLQTRNNLRRYGITTAGKEFLMQLYNPIKQRLN
jgi:hypothetical protein